MRSRAQRSHASVMESGYYLEEVQHVGVGDAGVAVLGGQGLREPFLVRGPCQVALDRFPAREAPLTLPRLSEVVVRGSGVRVG